ncbi:MAG: hypothetical protein HYW89_04415 [Candidatus Sungiibacteriota bacterium]|uniref:Glycogen debranching enzyme C-terminal domain-containing protein n=1 Tax=Candidatus Sungiibacteriota bacterium TaxID=2750080 RepID=A0A7T5UQI5_9BACT|nr:MAG: hypothetical protein HYW89_04415 [Candidatus Sungbacteria bacterium]
METGATQKIRQAVGVIETCIGLKGVWASPIRYKYQCWTRDFALATEEALLDLGRPEVVKLHLNELSRRQYSDGRIPIMFLDKPLRWLLLKAWHAIKNRRMSFLLRQYFSKDGIGQLSPWTRDSELLYALAVASFVRRTHDDTFLMRHTSHIRAALGYVESSLMKGGLIFGGDWRDTRPDLTDKFLLTNNCLLYQAYALLGETKKAEAIKAAINERFWTGSYYRDYIGIDDFDTLGNSLAILFDVAPQDRWPSIIESAEALDTPYGYKINKVTLPPKSKEETAVMLRTNQFGVIWPFIHGFMILAALKGGRTDIAKRQLQKWTTLDGFYEFYDPTTGRGYGSVDQVWSAALYFRTAHALGVT